MSPDNSSLSKPGLQLWRLRLLQLLQQLLLLLQRLQLLLLLLQRLQLLM